MKNNPLDKLDIKGLYELSNDKSLNNYARGYVTEYFRQRVFKYIKIGVITTILLFGILSIIIVGIRDTEANNDTNICNSNKCEARKQRLEECSGYTNNEEEKILCATYITLHKIEREVTPKEKEVIKEEIRNLKSLTTTGQLNLDRLAKAVAIAETSNCTKGYGATHNNCFGIKSGNTVKCKEPKGTMCRFATKEESYEAFKTIWGKWYQKYPTYELAHRWTGGDRVNNWLNIVATNY